MPFHQRAFLPLITVLLACLYAPAAGAWLDLDAASIQRLDNGLTLLVLEDHTFPVVSVQMLYRVGARNEITGATGLAHFLEHMAFRGSENFPGSGLVRSIYAAGGEWHGYTWLDQTTYFATAPAPQLDLLLRIEADRMARLDLAADDLAAERGAILAEMHGYENDPLSLLQDQLMSVLFLADPYRNNTIGWESDVRNIAQADLLRFYRRHYHPGNAVLAVVGDVSAPQVRQQVEHHFGDFASGSATPAPHTVEPEQSGERRIELRGAVARKYFRIAWRAPAATHADFPAFLLLQDLLAGGSGVSFLQDDSGTPARAASPLGTIADDLTTWFPPAARDYAFTISGSAPADADEPAIEQAVESALAKWRGVLADGGSQAAAVLEQARHRVREALVFDVQTTEDAAHQLAFFAGLGALDVLIGLPQAVEQVSATDLVRVMDRYLDPVRRTVGWYLPVQTPPGSGKAAGATNTAGPGGPPAASPPDSFSGKPEQDLPAVRTHAGAPAPPPGVTRLSSGIPVLFQRVTLSPTASLKIVTPPAKFPQDIRATPNDPLWGVTSLDFDFMAQDLTSVIARARAALKSAGAEDPPVEPDEADPAARLERHFQELLGLRAIPAGTPGSPLLLALCGDIDPEQALPLLEAGFGSLNPPALQIPSAAAAQRKTDIELRLRLPAAQVRIGYLVRAPAPGQPEALAWRLALYVFSHGYQGRLGQEAISRRGLIYYVENAYRSDGQNGWIELTMGVDPDRQPAMKSLLQRELLRMVREPPSQQEIDEAKSHLLGRHLSAAQSNPELTDQLARQWLWHGHLLHYDELKRRLDGIRRDDVIRLLPDFVSGSIVSIRNPSAAPAAAGASRR